MHNSPCFFALNAQSVLCRPQYDTLYAVSRSMEQERPTYVPCLLRRSCLAGPRGACIELRSSTLRLLGAVEAQDVTLYNLHTTQHTHSTPPALQFHDVFQQYDQREPRRGRGSPHLAHLPPQLLTPRRLSPGQVRACHDHRLRVHRRRPRPSCSVLSEEALFASSPWSSRPPDPREPVRHAAQHLLAGIRQLGQAVW